MIDLERLLERATAKTKAMTIRMIEIILSCAFKVDTVASTGVKRELTIMTFSIPSMVITLIYTTDSAISFPMFWRNSLSFFSGGIVYGIFPSVLSSASSKFSNSLGDSSGAGGRLPLSVISSCISEPLNSTTASPPFSFALA